MSDVVVILSEISEGSATCQIISDLGATLKVLEVGDRLEFSSEAGPVKTEVKTVRALEVLGS